jgi:hypothetical protein
MKEVNSTSENYQNQNLKPMVVFVNNSILSLQILILFDFS